MKTKTNRLIGVLIGVLLMTALLIAPSVLADTGPGVPDSGTIASGPATYTWFATRALTSSTTTTYTLQPSRVIPYYSADVFVTGVVSGSNAFTVTAQYSNDNSNWVDATYTYLANTSSTSVVTGTAGLTATTSTAQAIATNTYQVVINSNTTKFFQIPIVGEYLRFRIDNGGTVTPTIKVTLKNTGGR